MSNTGNAGTGGPSTSDRANYESNTSASRGTGNVNHASSGPLYTDQQISNRAAVEQALKDKNAAEFMDKMGKSSQEKRRKLYVIYSAAVVFGEF